MKADIVSKQPSQREAESEYGEQQQPIQSTHLLEAMGPLHA